MDKGILRFMAEAYLLLHAAGVTVEDLAQPDQAPEKKPRRQQLGHTTGKESKSGKPSEPGERVLDQTRTENSRATKN
jgi:hypothetical protein